ncbi:receptor-type tyrosine-protein phosphatase epsilon-like [Physella acuta]|uniref:receptor-type tyrosine-protein phosphatase epsilon-like n=1 Tax=Physella acuta TaxID=109671 RepID=UPI0027DB4808|nr:receptor-type tyrosine-protein phosphatase epsilon-like [Physella acuta]
MFNRIWNLKNKPAHQFTQFHFTSWPDKGVPLTPWGLVDFEQRVALGGASRPIVVHCSGKVDRKGIFIAVYNVIREAEDTGRIHVVHTADKLRHEGVLLTLTAEQYRCLYKVLERQNEVNSHFANLSRAKPNNYVTPPTEEEENVYTNR